MPSAAIRDDDLAVVVEVVSASPGLSRARIEQRLSGRREARRARIERALTAGVIHEDVSYARIRSEAVRTMRGLFPGPALELDVRPALDGSRLRADRLRNGIPVGLLAHELGVSRAQLHRWESGRQPVPAGFPLHEALEAAQTAVVLEGGQRRSRRQSSDVEELRQLLQDVRREPGRGRYAVARSQRRRRLLEQALAAGQLHEAPAFGRRNRQPVLGIFPGSARKARTAVTVSTEDLRAAREEAGWGQAAMARRLGVARTTLERWEGQLVTVPAWAAPAAAEALAAARSARRDREAVVLAAVQASPGLSRRALAATLGYTRGEYIGDQVDALLAAGLIHERLPGRRGVRHGLYPGAAPAEVLSAGQLVGLRRRAGLTQREVAALVCVHVQTVRFWERGSQPIPFEQQQRLREQLEALPPGKAPRLRRAGLLDASELAGPLLEALQETSGLTRHQIERRGLKGSQTDVDRALAELEAAGRIHRGRIGAGVSGRQGRLTLGRVGYLPGPAPTRGAGS